jgi:hypothetical protein
MKEGAGEPCGRFAPLPYGSVNLRLLTCGEGKTPGNRKVAHAARRQPSALDDIARKVFIYQN